MSFVPRPLCGAKRRNGEHCRRPAGWGVEGVIAGPCKLHGGASPSGRKAGIRKTAEIKARKAFDRLGMVQPVGDPVEALFDLASGVVAWRKHLDGLVDDLEALHTVDAFNVERIRVVVQLRGEAVESEHRILRTIAQLGLDERRVRISEAQVLIMLGALERTLVAMGMDTVRVSQAKDLLAAELAAPKP